MYKHFFKRVIDICIGLVALPFVLLVIIIFAPIIYFTDRGPVFYNANRAGKDYKPFKMFKLRSMYVNSPDLKNPDGRPDYFDELLARIRDIRASEKRFYQKLRELFALSSDYEAQIADAEDWRLLEATAEYGKYRNR